jgi:hypothetical protein
MPGRSIRGFSLIEALIATTLVAAALGALAHLFVMATRAVQSSRGSTIATLLAVEKLEELRSDLAGSSAEAASVSGSLDENVPGFSDSLAGCVRRWSITPLLIDAERLFLVQVLVMPAASLHSARTSSPPPGLGAVRLLAVEARPAS